MAKRKSKNIKSHSFRNKLLLNQWLVSRFGINPFTGHKVNGKVVRPFHKLAEPIRDPRLEGLDKDNLHYFYHHLGDCPLFSYTDPTADIPGIRISRDMLLTYEQNIVRHTQAINEKRHRPVVWKYFQWLTLIFVEINLDRYFGNREAAPENWITSSRLLVVDHKITATRFADRIFDFVSHKIPGCELMSRKMPRTLLRYEKRPQKTGLLLYLLPAAPGRFA